jgi:hypothetical protein
MKKRLNAFCVITLVILFGSLVSSLVESVSAGMAGFNMGYEQIKYEKQLKAQGKSQAQIDSLMKDRKVMLESMTNLSAIYIMPVNLKNSLKVTNTTTGKEMNIWPTEAMVSTPEKTANPVVMILLSPLCVVTGIWAFVLFMKLVYRINKKNEIFTWRHVRLLRRLGFMLIVYALFSIIINFYSVCTTASVVSMAGYAVDYAQCFDYIPLLLGFVAMVVAEVFAVGLKMREDQDLTI